MGIVVENVSKNFGDFVALDNVSLDIRQGEFVSIMGPSGAGKSTLVKIIAGGLQATSGRMLFEGEEKSFHAPADAPHVHDERRHADRRDDRQHGAECGEDDQRGQNCEKDARRRHPPFQHQRPVRHLDPAKRMKASPLRRRRELTGREPAAAHVTARVGGRTGHCGILAA